MVISPTSSIKDNLRQKHKVNAIHASELFQNDKQEDQVQIFEASEMPNFEVVAKMAQQEMKKSARQYKEDKQSATFEFHGKKIILDRRSLFLFEARFNLRKAAVWLTEWKWFDRFILLIIAFNTVLLIIDSQLYKIRLYPEEKYLLKINNEIRYIEYVLSCIYILEFLIKIVSRGFIVHKNSYIRNYFNVLDFFIVIVSFLGFFQMRTSHGLRALRIFRILRPCKSINALPKMRLQIKVLFHSISGLVNVLLFVLFLSLIYSIIGTQAFSGGQYKQCRIDNYPTNTSNSNFSWPVIPGIPQLCSSDQMCGDLIKTYIDVASQGDYQVNKCGQSMDYNVTENAPNYFDSSNITSFIFYDKVNFNNIGMGLLAVLQTFTLEGWTILMYNYMDSISNTGSAIFFITLVIFGSFFTLNLILATLIESFYETKKKFIDLNEIIKNQEDIIAQKHSKQKPTKQLETLINFDLFKSVATPKGSVRNKEPEVEKFLMLSPKTEEKTIVRIISAVKEEELDEKPIWRHETNEDTTVKRLNSEENQDASNGKNLINPRSLSPYVGDDSETLDSSHKMCCQWERLDPEQRSKKNRIFMIFYKLISHWGFNFIILLLIIANTFTLMSQSFPTTNKKDNQLIVANTFFIWTFTLEMIFKLIGLGSFNYRKDIFNVFDCLIVIVSLVDWIINFSKTRHNGTIQVFRALRLLRLMKIAKSWKSLQIIFQKILRSLVDMVHFSILLLLFIFIFALIGMEAFAYRVRRDQNIGQMIPFAELQARFDQDPSSLVPIRENFDSIGRAMAVVFSMTTLEDWELRLYQNMSPFDVKYHFPIMIFFCSIVMIGSFVLLSLFTAILLQNFDTCDEIESESENHTKKLRYEIKSDNEGKYEKKTVKSQFMLIMSILRFEFLQIFNQRLPTQKVIVKVDAENSQDRKEISIEEDNIKVRKEISLDADDPQDRKQIQNFQLKEEFVQLEQTDLKTQIKFPKDENKIEALSQKGNKDSIESTIIPVNKNFMKTLNTNCIHHAACILPHLNHTLQRKRLSSKNLLVNLLVFDKLEIMKSEKKRYEENCKGKSLYIFSNQYKFRMYCWKIVNYNIFRYFILVVILLSSIQLAIGEQRLQDPDGKMIQILQKIDYAVTAIFTFEVILKIIAYGFISENTSYLRFRKLNVLDFFIVLAALISIGFQKIRFLKIFRVARILRPLRFVSWNKGLQIELKCLIQSFPSMLRIQLVQFFLVAILAILHTMLFAGKIANCQIQQQQPTWSKQKIYSMIINKYDCLNYGGEWYQNDFNFNNFGRSFLTIFSISTTENWITVMWSQVDAVAPDFSSRLENNQSVILLCIFTILVTHTLCQNLFIGVVVETFQQQKEKMSNNSLLCIHQQRWIDVQIMAYNAKAIVVQKQSTNFFRLQIKKLILHKAFEFFIVVCIFANTIILSLSWYGISQEMQNVTQKFNYAFIAIFAFEAVLKLTGLGMSYFKTRQYQSWNIFDFIVVTLTIIILILESLKKSKLGHLASVLRSFRMIRVIRIIKNFQRLQVIFKTFTDALPQMLSLGILLFLLSYMYAIIGMMLFGFVNLDSSLQTSMDHHGNFQNFGRSLLLLLRISTGESWNGIMFDCARQKSAMFQCKKKFNYNDWRDSGFQSTNKCGSPFWAYLFFHSFIIIVTQILLNLFIAVVIDAFMAQTESAQLPVTEKDIKDFADAWKDFDPTGKGSIKVSQLEPLIIKIASKEKCELLQLKKNIVNREGMRRLIMAHLQIPTYKNFTKFRFYDVLLCLCKYKFENVYNRERGQENKIRRKNLEEIKKYFASDTKLDEYTRRKVIKNAEKHLEKVDELNSQKFQRDFTDLLQDLSKFDKKIARVRALQHKAKDVIGLRQLQIDFFGEDEQYFYTSRHYVLGLQIIKLLRQIQEKKKGQKTVNASHQTILQEGQTALLRDNDLINDEIRLTLVRNLDQDNQQHLDADSVHNQCSQDSNTQLKSFKKTQEQISSQKSSERQPQQQTETQNAVIENNIDPDESIRDLQSDGVMLCGHQEQIELE